mgnify:CR=1 FL=1
MAVYLDVGERLDDLMLKGYKIIQHPKRFCFSMDPVLLSSFVNVGPGERIVDLGTGNGILPLLLAGKSEAGEIIGIEIQAELAWMAKRSVKLNGLEDRVRIIPGDLRDPEILRPGTWDVVVSNPPYRRRDSGKVNPSSGKAIAHHEITCTLHDVAAAAGRLLKNKGRFAIVYRPERLNELLAEMDGAGIAPKRGRMVYPHAGDPANLVLVEGVKGGGPDMKWEAPLIVYKDKQGNYTDETLKMYGMDADRDG